MEGFFVLCFGLICFVVFVAISVDKVDKNRKLVTCSLCGGKVSNYAEKCPHCGNPMNEGKVAANVDKIRAAVEKQDEKKFGECGFCGGKIASVATMCPHCGAPVKNR